MPQVHSKYRKRYIEWMFIDLDYMGLISPEFVGYHNTGHSVFR